MPKIQVLPWQKLARVFELDGWTLDRTKGDHKAYVKAGFSRPVIIPMWKEVAVFIIKNNMKTAKMSRERYFELLNKV
mgnify:CR=1 FL=1